VENTNNSLTAVAAQEGSIVSVVGDTYRIVIGSEQTNGAYALIDMLIPPKGGPGPHSHANFQEAFYVIDGD
jgi:quercetin dioxygenase-like cupin family protein